MYIASNGIKTAVIMTDNSPENPRENENLGTMVCWHRRYSLGDNHEFKEPLHFAEHLATEHLSEKDVFTAMKNGDFEDFRLVEGEKEGDPYTIEANYSFNRKWEKTDWKVSKDLQLIDNGNPLDLESDIFDNCLPRELLKVCEKYGDVAILPLQLYDHSGISMSTSSYVGRAPHAEWDSGTVGFIYMDKQTAMKELAMPAETLKIARMWTIAERQPVTFERRKGDVWLGFDEVMKEQGFSPVMHAEHIKNLYDPALGATDNQPLIDEANITMGAVYKKDHTLYVFGGYNEDTSKFDLKPVATFNPDLRPLREEEWKSRAEEVLTSEVREYDNYLTGEVYGYKLYEGLDEVDSCWGFNPGTRDIREVMNDELSGWFGGKMDFELEYDSDFDIDEFYASHDFPQIREDVAKKVATQLYEDFQIQIPFPYGMSFEDIRGNKDGIFDKIVQDVYDSHAAPTAENIREAIFDHAGVARSVQPKISVTDLDPNRDYTAEELMGVLNKKPSLADILASAEARKGNPDMGMDAPAHEQGR